MNEITVAAAIATVIIVAQLAVNRLGRRREILMLKRWAERSQFQLLEFRQRAFSEPAPFSFWSSHRTPNYFIKVRDQEGKERSGWVRLGNFFESIYWGGRDEVKVKWDEASSEIRSLTSQGTE